ncbi:hypothetical protein SLE2022_319210 [Rubroshorea leprosula]
MFSKGKQIQESIKVETLIDLEEQIKRFKTHKFDLVKPKYLYENANSLFSAGSIFQHYQEVQISCVKDSDSVTLRLLSENGYFSLERMKYSLVHIGLITIGVKTLHRKGLGTKCLLTLLDTRHQDMIQSLIGSIEIDLSEQGGFAYFTPNFQMDIKAFKQFLKIGIMTKGYSMAEGEKNLLVCIGFTGQITHNGTTNYRVTSEEICEIFGTKGIKAVQAQHLDSTYLNGTEWNITKFLSKPIMVPTRNTLYQNYKGETSLSFSDYENILPEQEENEETVEIKMLHLTEEIEKEESEPSWLQTLRKREEHFEKWGPIKDKYNEEWEFIETYFSSKGKEVNAEEVLTLKYHGEDIEDQILDLELPVEAYFKNQKPILQIIHEYESQQEKIFMNVTPENPNQNPNQSPSAPTRSEIEENSRAPRSSRVFGSRTYQLGGRYPIP